MSNMYHRVRNMLKPSTWQAGVRGGQSLGQRNIKLSGGFDQVNPVGRRGEGKFSLMKDTEKH